LGNILGIINYSGIADKFSLSQNYPNPFNPITKIKFSIPNAQYTRLLIFDALGREVASLVNSYLPGGSYEVEWEASAYPSGVYFYELISGEYKETKQTILIK
jgi:hypothetical protein